MRRLLAIAVLMGIVFGASAQESSFQKRYSIEVGTGIPPLYMDYMTTADRLAERGMSIDKESAFYPVVSLSGVMSVSDKNEFTLTIGTSWCHHKVIQYSVFGTDPNGKPRYNLHDGKPAGWMNSSLQWSVNLNWRHLWNPENMATFYSGLGIGYSPALGPTPVPTLTPVALRVGGNHFYGFIECTIGAVATFAHGGLGWRF